MNFDEWLRITNPEDKQITRWIIENDGFLNGYFVILNKSYYHNYNKAINKWLGDNKIYYQTYNTTYVFHTKNDALNFKSKWNC